MFSFLGRNDNFKITQLRSNKSIVVAQGLRQLKLENTIIPAGGVAWTF